MSVAIRILNLMSAVIMLATGIYVQSGFASILTPGVRALIVVVALVYFLLRLDQFVVREAAVLPSVER